MPFTTTTKMTMTMTMTMRLLIIFDRLTSGLSEKPRSLSHQVSILSLKTSSPQPPALEYPQQKPQKPQPRSARSQKTPDLQEGFGFTA